jgi:3-oxoacyl-(acyl-carrier-protein) synthase
VVGSRATNDLRCQHHNVSDTRAEIRYPLTGPRPCPSAACHAAATAFRPALSQR